MIDEFDICLELEKYLTVVCLSISETSNHDLKITKKCVIYM